MRRPLLTLCKRLSKTQLNRFTQICLILLFTSSVSILSAQFTFDYERICNVECDDGCRFLVEVCFDDNDPIENGDYTVSEYGGIIPVVFAADQCSPPLTFPTPFTVSDSDGDDIYCFEAYMASSGEAAYVEFERGDDSTPSPVDYQDCPVLAINGPSTVCFNSDGVSMVKDYTVPGAIADLNDAGWAIDPPVAGALPVDVDNNTVSIDWSAYAGAYLPEPVFTLSFTGEDEWGCEIEEEIEVTLYDLSDRALVSGANTVVCGADEHYDLLNVLDPNDALSLTWTVTGAGNVLTMPPGSLGEANIVFDAGVGTYTIEVMGVSAGGCEFSVDYEVEVINDPMDLDLIFFEPAEPVCYGQKIKFWFDDADLPSPADVSSLNWTFDPPHDGVIIEVVEPFDDTVCVTVNFDPTFVGVPNTINIDVDGLYAAGGVCGFSDFVTVDLYNYSINGSIEGEDMPQCGASELYTLSGIDMADLAAAPVWTVMNGSAGATTSSDLTFMVDWDAGIGAGTVAVTAETMDGCDIYVEFTTTVLDLGEVDIEGDTYVCAGDVVCYSLPIGDVIPSGTNLIWTLDADGITNDVNTTTAGVTNVGADLTITETAGSEIEACITFGAAMADEVMTLTVSPAAADPCFAATALLPIQLVNSPTPIQLACNNSVNISVNGLCELAITADMILEGDYGGNYDQFDLIIKDAATGVMIPDGVLDASYIGTTLEVMVQQDCSPNSCWGYIVVEDKSVPTPPCGDDINTNATPSAGDFTIDVGAGDGDARVGDFINDFTIDLTSSNNGVSDDASACFTVTIDGTVNFEWTYLSYNSEAACDPFGYSIDPDGAGPMPAVYTQLTTGVACDLVPDNDLEQSGAEAVDVTLGAEFCFIASTQDAALGQAVTAVTNVSVNDWVACSYVETGDPSSLNFDPGVIITALGDNEWRLVGYDNCTNATLTYFDQVAAGAPFCDDNGPGSIIERIWRVTDDFGNTASCTQEIYIKRPSALSLVWPPNWDSAIAGSNPSLDACGDWAQDENGNPHPSVSGYPDGLFCMNLSLIGYEDFREIPKCGDGSPARKILRKWSVWDLCTEQDYTHTQIITLVDHEPPLWTSATNIFNYPADPYGCSASFDVYPYPEDQGFGALQSLSDCSAFTIRTFYLPPFDGTDLPDLSVDFIEVPMNSDRGFTIPAVGGSAVWVRYMIEDACYNVSNVVGMNLDEDGNVGTNPGVVAFEVFFDDVTPPNPVCDLYSVVSLDDVDGCAFAGPESFNDGSTDNCGIDYMKVRRMDTNCGDYSEWGDIVKFCCEDLGGPVMVALGIWDHEDNFNQCMVEVQVDDPNGPSFDCPDDVSVDCGGYNLDNLSNFGEPSGSDNCSIDWSLINEKATIDECGFGYIERSWNIITNGNNVAVCTQTITVENRTPFNESSNINWPADIDVNCSQGTDTDVTNVPTYKGQLACSNVFSSYDDLEFQYVEDACLKILRYWTVVDWCNDGAQFYHTQVIKVLDDNGPTNFANCQNQTYEGGLDASCHIDLDDLVVTANDNCTENLHWTHSIDLNTNGTNEVANAPGADANGMYPVGTHTITYTALDDCENQSSCTKVITVVDDKNPTPYCLEELVVVISPETSCAEVWASDFDRGSFDGCDLNAPITMSFSPNPTDQSFTYCCSDLDGANVDSLAMQVYAIDEEGNSDYCTATLIVQDNSNTCEDATEGASRVAGSIYNEQNIMVENVEVNIEATLPDFPSTMMSNTGSYAFDDLAWNEDYIIRPKKDDNYINGVSTLDIVIIQRHILGISDLDSPYKIIAADADNSEHITAFDLVELRKLILGVYEELPANNSWRFVREDFVFPNASQPWPFDEAITIPALSEDMNDEDFFAVKIGDVNFSAILNAQDDDTDTRNLESFGMDIDNASFEKGELVSIPFKASDYSELIGFQTTLQFNVERLAFNEIKSGSIDITNANVAAFGKDQGYVGISWNDSKNITFEEDDVLFTVEFIAQEKGSIADMVQLNSALIQSEAYMDNSGQMEIKQLTLGTQMAPSTFAVFQNRPNPFSTHTTIGFTLADDEDVSLTILDVNGRVVYTQNAHYNRGYNEVVLDKSQLTNSGVLYYQIDTKTNSAIRKMILIK